MIPANKNTGLSDSSLNDNDTHTKSFSPRNILKGTSVCLTGFRTERKKKMMKIVEQLGGSYTRELLTRSTTHLIAGCMEGAKFKEAKKCPDIAIVGPKWLEMCALEKRMVPTNDYCLVEREKIVDASLKGNTDGSSIQNSLQNICYHLLTPGTVPPNNLFSACSFILIGFSVKDRMCMELGSSAEVKDLLENDEALKIKQNLCSLIRRSMGTIYWDANVNITHVVVNEDCDAKTRNDVKTFCRYHGKNPVAISPEWITSCLTSRQRLDEANFPPRTRGTSLNETTKTSQPISIGLSPDKGIFHGSFFLLTKSLQQMSPHEVTFNQEEAERLIKSHGGQFLSPKSIKLLSRDARGISKSEDDDRICYVLNLSGPFNLDKYIDSEPSLKQICQDRIRPVSVVWLQACDRHDTLISPYQLPFIFHPQPWPLRKIFDANLKVTCTGFNDIERSGLRHVLATIGVSYTDDMGNKNTHLICKEATCTRGAKYQKAVEWGLHVVKIEWVYYIMRNGYDGGSEKEFLLSIS